MQLPFLASAAGLVLFASAVHAVPPSISNIRASQRPGTKLVDVTYSLVDPDSTSITVQVEMSSNSGQSYDLPVRSVSGAIGAGVTPGSSKTFTWNAGLDWNGNFSNTCRVRLHAFDNSTPVPPLGMVFIPSGSFVMGWSSATEIGGTVTLTKAYFMDRYEVSAALWNSVRDWSLTRGYSIGAGAWQAADHPVNRINWYDAVKWCNARSEREGLTPCYYTDDTQTTVYRAGDVNVANAQVKWSANGYRLPTDAEWERAARGGLDRKVFPWGDTIAGHQANYIASGDPFDGQRPSTTPVGYFNGNQVPTGQNMANGYGLYDMAGNVSEWCWDWYGSAPFGQVDPIGPDTPVWAWRIVRGGSYESSPNDLRCASRPPVEPRPSFPEWTATFGVRCIRGL